jgi:hypothetical protein
MHSDLHGEATRGLGGYVHAVARAVGVSPEATSYEVSDTATAYLGLNRRVPKHPDRDLMLVWGERDGWLVAVETDPVEEPIVLAYLGGDVLPGPEAVARFVTDLVAGGAPGQTTAPGFRSPGDRDELAERLARYVAHHPG